jgi:hypothetical protein
VKQLSLGLIMYAADNDDYYMKRINGTNTAGVEHWWDFVRPYTKNDEVQRCPDFTPAANKPVELHKYGYGLNTHVVTVVGQPAFSTTQYVDAAATALMADASLGDFYARPNRRTRVAFANSVETSPDRLACSAQKSRHGSANGLQMNSGGSVIGYGDGHAKYQTSSYVMFRLGIHPEGPNVGDPLFFEGSSGAYCVGGPVIGP